MVFSTVQLAQSATGKFQFNAAVDEFIPPATAMQDKISKQRMSKGLNLKAKEFVPPTAQPHKPAAPIRAPPGLEKSLGLSVHAKEFVPLPAPAPAPAAVWHCAINLDDYTDDESEDETKDTVDIKQWRGLCGRLASPYIWSDDKEDFVDEADTAISDSEADTAEPSSHESESDGCSGCESP